MFARRMVVPPHRDGGQAQYVDIPMPTSPQDDDLGETLIKRMTKIHHKGQEALADYRSNS